jgi:hypothetical protein
MSSLFVLYVILVVCYVMGVYFNSSLESVQRYHQKLLDLNWLPIGIRINNISVMEMLFHCVSSSVLVFEDLSYYNYIKIYNLSGFGYTRNIQNIGSVIVKNESVVVAFISTANMSDVMFSISNKLIPIKDGKIHEGYYTRCIENLPMLIRVLYNIPGIMSKQLILTGHSLGGAIASVFGYILLEFGFNPIIITFGSPKFGNHQLKYHLEKKLKIFNILNRSDPVINKPSKKRYTRIGEDIYNDIDTGNDNVNHGIKVYHEIVMNVKESSIKKRGHRFDEIISRWILDLFG